MQILWQDLTYGLRMLLRNPGFTAGAVCALALGIGANTAIFSVVNAVLLRSFPYEGADRLVMIWTKFEKLGLPQTGVSEPELLELTSPSHVFEQVAAYSSLSFNLTSRAEPERIVGARVSSSIFATLGVQPILGRAFVFEEDTPGTEPVVILSHGLWQRLFGADPKLVGEVVTLGDKTYTVVGILPPGFRSPDDTELWIPLAVDTTNQGKRGAHYLKVLARLKPGVTLIQAKSDTDAIAARLQRQYPESYPENSGWGMKIVSLHDEVVGNTRPALLILFGAVGFVLLISCANVANLSLVRAASRQKEIAIRAALGAGRFRLVRQLLTESVVLAVLGGAVGLLLAFWCIDLMVTLSPNNIPRLNEAGIDGRVLGFTLIVSLLTSAIFGLVPALQASKPDLNETLKKGGSYSAGGWRSRTRSLLVVSEVALALLLLIGAGLMIRSFLRLMAVEPGFNPENVLTARISLSDSKYSADNQRVAFYQQVLERLAALPGVQSAGAGSGFPLRGALATSFSIDGRSFAPQESQPEADRRVISSDYFAVMGISLRKGRYFTDSDDQRASEVAIIDESLARRFWPEEDPIGKRIKLGAHDSKNPWLLIVGVVGHVRHHGLDIEGRGQIYTPYLQNSQRLIPLLNPLRSMFLVIRTRSDPLNLAGAVRNQIWAVDESQPVYDITTMEQLLSKSISPRRFNMVLLGVFAGVALVIATVGLYGVTAYSVSQRTQEIGIRMALGALQKDVLRLVLRQGIALTLMGVTIGLGSALIVTRALSTLLFGVSATDPVTFVVFSVVMSVVSVVASYIPARRAAKVDPIVALRYE